MNGQPLADTKKSGFEQSTLGFECFRFLKVRFRILAVISSILELLFRVRQQPKFPSEFLASLISMVKQLKLQSSIWPTIDLKVTLQAVTLTLRRYQRRQCASAVIKMLEISSGFIIYMVSRMFYSN